MRKRWEFEKFYLRRIKKSLRNRSLFNTLYLIRDDRLFDLIYGVKTFRLKYLNKLINASENIGLGYGYEPVNYTAFYNVFKNLKISCSDYNFIDLGCGMGYALMLASKYNFKKLIGIELSEELASICQDNLKSFFAREAKQHIYEIINLNVINYTFPKDKNLIFMFNPFNAKIMESTFVNLLKICDINNNYVIYINAQHKDVLINLDYKMRYFNATDPLNLCKWGIAVFETPTT